MRQDTPWKPGLRAFIGFGEAAMTWWQGEVAGQGEDVRENYLTSQSDRILVAS